MYRKIKSTFQINETKTVFACACRARMDMPFDTTRKLPTKLAFWWRIVVSLKKFALEHIRNIQGAIKVIQQIRENTTNTINQEVDKNYSKMIQMTHAHTQADNSPTEPASPYLQAGCDKGPRGLLDSFTSATPVCSKIWHIHT
jgi:hypothetical protein